MDSARCLHPPGASAEDVDCLERMTRGLSLGQCGQSACDLKSPNVKYTPDHRYFYDRRACSVGVQDAGYFLPKHRQWQTANFWPPQRSAHLGNSSLLAAMRKIERRRQSQPSLSEHRYSDDVWRDVLPPLWHPRRSNIRRVDSDSPPGHRTNDFSEQLLLATKATLYKRPMMPKRAARRRHGQCVVTQ